MLIKGTRACVLALLLLLPSSLAAQQNARQAPAPTYTRSEIDAKLDEITNQIKSMLGTDTHSKADLDAKLDTIRAELKPLQALSVYSKGEIDAREAAQKAQIDALLTKVNLIPWWLPVAVAGFSAVVSLFSLGVSAATYVRGDRTRAEDQRELRKTAAYTLIDQWKEREDLAAHVHWILTNPSSLSDQNYGPDCRLKLERLGNWFNTLGTRWKRNEADGETLEAEDMRKLARTFWSQFQQARTALANDPDLQRLQSEWPDLEWLVVH
jgi:hypothetical protein